jgi:hypothetical protein
MLPITKLQYLSSALKYIRFCSFFHLLSHLLLLNYEDLLKVIVATSNFSLGSFRSIQFLYYMYILCVVLADLPVPPPRTSLMS